MDSKDTKIDLYSPINAMAPKRACCILAWACHVDTMFYRQPFMLWPLLMVYQMTQSKQGWCYTKRCDAECKPSKKPP